MKTFYIRTRGILDRAMAAGAIIVLSPVFAGVVLAIRVRMGSPVFFHQDRIGQHGRVFRIHKFRTMINDAERLGGGYMPDALNLIPPLGAFLRRTSLDELPQLWNILKGDIAIVGPRPALVSHLPRYTPRQRRRVDVPQGLTGLAQVRYRNDAPWSVRIESDLEYIDRLGPRLDIELVFRTVLNVFRGSGIRTNQTALEVDDLGPESERNHTDVEQ